MTSQGFRFPLPGQEIVQVRGRVAELLRELPAVAPARQHDWSVANAAVREFMTPPDTGSGPGVHPTDVIRTLRRLAPADAVVTNDAGNFSGFLHRYWCFTDTRAQLGPCNGAMGYGVPSAVAAKLSRLERTVIAMVGDGGALMTGQEIETGIRHQAPVVVIVFQNGRYGTIALHQVKSRRTMSAVSIGGLDRRSRSARSISRAGHADSARRASPSAPAKSWNW
ncbi:thiamine pyrophosphate-dependent enzyme [Saccharopolyspora spinosa]|uniref:thiamine pyrophosphate-dependent enzyme n=1 Tax=Saccharopolyspora spinosa TaxID=60894 RepID=UPI001EEF318E|nr:thiamine pyrophosphate-dependent enzyme [Saccharopolyspora spinosa]